MVRRSCTSPCFLFPSPKLWLGLGETHTCRAATRTHMWPGAYAQIDLNLQALVPCAAIVSRLLAFPSCHSFCFLIEFSGEVLVRAELFNPRRFALDRFSPHLFFSRPHFLTLKCTVDTGFQSRQVDFWCRFLWPPSTDSRLPRPPFLLDFLTFLKRATSWSPPFSSFCTW